MLIDSDKQEFASIVRGTADAYGKEATNNLLRMFWGVLREFSMDQIRNAFTAHVRCSKFMPAPKEIIDRINGQRPGPDEAWAMVPKDEETSAVVTEEMLGAFSVAAPLLHEGDKIAARMAFKDSYVRLCEAASASGKPIKWVISRGWDKSSLGCVIDEAVRLGRITAQDAAPHLAEIEFHSPLVAGLLEGTKGTVNEEKGREFLAKLKSALKSGQIENLDQIKLEVEEKDRQLMEDGHGKAA